MTITQILMYFIGWWLIPAIISFFLMIAAYRMSHPRPADGFKKIENSDVQFIKWGSIVWPVGVATFVVIAFVVCLTMIEDWKK